MWNILNTAVDTGKEDKYFKMYTNTIYLYRDYSIHDQLANPDAPGMLDPQYGIP